MEAKYFKTEYRFRDHKKFEEKVQDANLVWKEIFGEIYDEYCCPSDYVIIGYNSNDYPVVSAIYNLRTINMNDDDDDIEYKCFISSLAAYPKNIGNGSRLINTIINEIKTNCINIKYVYVNIKNDENKDNLINFYNKFGFTEYGNNYNNEIQLYMYLK